MKKLTSSALLFILSLLMFTAFSPWQNIMITDNKEPNGGAEYVFENTECLSENFRNDIQVQIQNNIESLRRQGKIHDYPRAIVQFAWPLRAANGLEDYNYWGISNYVDQNNSAGLLDYNCGTRTYNGHRGTDIYTWPFGWHKMDNNHVEVIAGAPGVIIYKSEGQFDRSCAMNGNLWNAVYVRHADNSVAWYGHLKKNSVTTKNVGDNVALGEYLGVLGSSGNSTGPHLHFEVYNSSNILIDPWQGTCNSLNAQTWWQAQKSYYDPKINALMTHSHPPSWPTCPQQEIINERKNFNPGDSIFTVAYYSDQMAAMQTQFSVTMPNGNVWNNWNHSSNTSYGSSYWYWSYKLPNNAASGTWKFKATFNSVSYEKSFEVAPVGIEPIADEIPKSFAVKQNYPNPFNPVTNIEFSIPVSSAETRLIIYDAAGREIAVLVNQDLKAGNYKVDWDASFVPSGVYFYKLVSGDFIETKKMVLIK